MRRTVVRAAVIVATGLGIGLVGAAPAVAAPPTDSWGQEVKACNESSCYPGGTNRGAYVRGQSHDDQGPGYSWEIHNLANPGKADPKNHD